MEYKTKSNIIIYSDLGQVCAGGGRLELAGTEEDQTAQTERDSS